MLFSDIIIKYRYPKHCFCFVPIKLVDNGRTSGYKKFYNFLTECKYLAFYIGMGQILSQLNPIIENQNS